jgi:uncharacterized protein (TIGR03067 family)
MKTAVPLVSLLLIFTDHAPSADPPAKKMAPLEGNWVVESATWGGKPVDLLDTDKKVKSIIWRFNDDKFHVFTKGSKEAYEGGTYRVDGDKSPKHLDLTLTEGELIATRKCLFALDGDKLKIAMTFWFAPSTPAEELADAKKMCAKRPETITPKEKDLVMVWTLKRQKD